jgi:hypothetical protein
MEWSSEDEENEEGRGLVLSGNDGITGARVECGAAGRRAEEGVSANVETLITENEEAAAKSVAADCVSDVIDGDLPRDEAR